MLQNLSKEIVLIDNLELFMMILECPDIRNTFVTAKGVATLRQYTRAYLRVEDKNKIAKKRWTEFSSYSA